MVAILGRAEIWLRNQPDTADTAVLKERFAEFIVREINGRTLPQTLPESFHAYFNDIFDYDILRRTGLVNILSRISS